jgi:7-cyano-7-deazaguanine reductase
MKKWSNKALLKTLPNPSGDGYEINIKNPEITFIGVKDQPDFATIWIVIYPKDTIVELKSLKKYFQDFRNTLVSYERLINVIYDDLKEVYVPHRLRVEMDFNPRGGLASKLTIDSDWSIRGGEEKFNDWAGKDHRW